MLRQCIKGSKGIPSANDDYVGSFPILDRVPVAERPSHTKAISWLHGVESRGKGADPVDGKAYKIPLAGCRSYPKGRFTFAENGKLTELPWTVKA